MFDWRQIERWGGNVGRLPANTVFVNRPASPWQQYGSVIVGTTLFILLQGVTIVALALSMRRRRSSERIREESEQRFRATFEQAAVGIALVSPDGRWLRVNDRLCEITGYSRDELLACRFQDITHPDDLEADRVSVLKILAGEIRTAALEKRYVHKDGSIVWINVTFSLLRKQDGQPDYFIAMVEDIRARKEAERALAESQAAMLRGREEARLAALNQMEDAIAAKRSAELAEEEIRRLNADLERRVIERTAELTEANKELDSFAYAVSHDLRAPLRAMSGFSEALHEEYGDRLDSEAKAYIDQIGIASRKMGELIEGILALSRSTRGEIRRDAVDISSLSDSILAELERGEPGRSVIVEIEAGLVAHGDARMIESIMRNLLGNAWKYTGKTETPRIRVTSCRCDGELGIAVADNGGWFRHGAHRSAIQAVPSPAPSGRISGDRHRSCDRAAHGASARRKDTCHRGAGTGRHLMFYLGPSQWGVQMTTDGDCWTLADRADWRGYCRETRAAVGVTTGFGTVIIRRIITRHGGNISAHAVPGAGSTLCISLPATPHHGDES